MVVVYHYFLINASVFQQKTKILVIIPLTGILLPAPLVLLPAQTAHHWRQHSPVL